MPRKTPKTGVLFWVWTFLVGLFSPGKGKRRIHNRIKGLEKVIADRDELIDVQKSNTESLTAEAEFLRGELAYERTENKRLRTALGMDDAINRRTPSWSKKTPDDEVDTIRIPVVN